MFDTELTDLLTQISIDTERPRLRPYYTMTGITMEKGTQQIFALDLICTCYL